MNAQDTTPNSAEFHPADLSQAKAALAKLPMLGPVMWLYARDPNKRWTFIADQDWLLLPPLVLDQCKLYVKQDIPWAYCSWAMVTDAVHERLKSGHPRLAPHEWQGGTHCWLIDVTAPFGQVDKVLEDLRGTALKSKPVYRFRANAAGSGAPTFELLEAL
jgi:cytolysin-activating lysine-acyltransferase